jgi:hypothetical protein
MVGIKLKKTDELEERYKIFRTIDGSVVTEL